LEKVIIEGTAQRDSEQENDRRRIGWTMLNHGHGLSTEGAIRAAGGIGEWSKIVQPSRGVATGYIGIYTPQKNQFNFKKIYVFVLLL